MNYLKKLFNKNKQIKSEEFSFTDEEQFYMLFENDYSKISGKKSNDLFDKIISINLTQFMTWLDYDKLFKKYSYQKGKNMDGVWIEEENGKYYILYQERGVVQWKNKKKSQGEIIEFFGKLIISIVPKYSHLNPL